MSYTSSHSIDTLEKALETSGLQPTASQASGLRRRAIVASSGQHSPGKRLCCAHVTRIIVSPHAVVVSPPEVTEVSGLRPQLPKRTPVVLQRPPPFFLQPAGLRPAVGFSGSSNSSELVQSAESPRQRRYCQYAPLLMQSAGFQRQLSLQSPRANLSTPRLQHQAPKQEQQPSGFIRPSLGPSRESIPVEAPQSDNDELIASVQSPGLRPLQKGPSVVE